MSSAVETKSNRSWLLPFVALSALWGSSFLFIKVSLDSFTPVQIAFGRVAIGALILIVVVYATGDRLPRSRTVWAHTVFTSLFLHAIPFTLFPFGEERISSVLAGIWNATTPLFTVLVVLLMLPSEHPTRQRVVGLLVGFFGVLIVFGPWQSLGASSWIGSLACILAALCYGIGTPYTRRFLSHSDCSGVSLAATQLFVGALWLLPLMFFQRTPVAVTARTGGSLVALGVLGTGIAFWLYWILIRQVGATATTTVTYVVPIWSTLLGVLVLGEVLTWNEPVGAVVILLGVAVSQGLIRGRSVRQPPDGPT